MPQDRAAAKDPVQNKALWPASKIDIRPIADLIAYAGNPRTHSPEQVELLMRSIEKWGWTMPVLVDEDGMIIAGHGRVMAAHKLELTEVPVMVARGWSDDMKRAYVIADNSLGLAADWDPAQLRTELGDLQQAGFDLTLMGFGDVQLVEFMTGIPGGKGPGQRAMGNLAESFGVPPFSVLNARGGWWQSRKAAWIALGIQSELGRGEGAEPGGSKQPAVNPKTGKIARADSKGRAIPGTDAKHRRKPKDEAAPAAPIDPAQEAVAS